MTRVKRSVHAKKKRREMLERAKGFRGEANSNYKRAKEAVMKADAYAYRDRRNRKRDFRRLWITRINAAARLNGMSYGRSCTACSSPRSSWTARSWPTSPCATRDVLAIRRRRPRGVVEGRCVLAAPQRHRSLSGRRSSTGTAPFFFALTRLRP
jgi:ribosomal protein L20